MIFGWSTFKINFRCQIENQVSDYRLLGASSFNAIAGGEGSRLYVIKEIFRVLQNPHLIHTTPRVASVTVALKPGFDCR